MKRLAQSLLALSISLDISASDLYQIVKHYSNQYVTFCYYAYDTYAAVGNGKQCAIGTMAYAADVTLESSVGGQPLKVIADKRFCVATKSRQ